MQVLSRVPCSCLVGKAGGGGTTDPSNPFVSGEVAYFENVGNSSKPVFKERRFSDNPFYGTCDVDGTAPGPSTAEGGAGADPFPWPGVSTATPQGYVCGECKVLVRGFSSYGTCDSYCAQMNMSCYRAWEDAGGDACSEAGGTQGACCTEAFESSCSAVLGGDNDAAKCQCAHQHFEVNTAFVSSAGNHYRYFAADTEIGLKALSPSPECRDFDGDGAYLTCACCAPCAWQLQVTRCSGRRRLRLHRDAA